MRVLGTATLVAMILALVIGHAEPGEANRFLAYSMREAERQVKESERFGAQVRDLGGITRVTALVYDGSQNDLIVVGQVNPNLPTVTLNDFATALRARLVYRTWPEVSIEKTQETAKTGRQLVRYEGGIADTSFGRDLLEADIILKKLSLGLLPTDIWGVRSYWNMAVERHTKDPRQQATFHTRFWFYTRELDWEGKKAQGTLVIRDHKVGIRTQVLGARLKDQAVADPSHVRNDTGEAFAQAMTASYDDFVASYPSIGRVKTLLDLVALAHGIESGIPAPASAVQFWLRDYKIAHMATPRDYPLLTKEETIAGADYSLEVSGGVKLEVQLARLNEDGDTTVVRDLVLKTRPKGNPLTWVVPLDGWRLAETRSERPGELGSVRLGGGDPSPTPKDVGMSVTERIIMGGPMRRVLEPAPLQATAPSHWAPHVTWNDRLPSPKYSPNVGGVMLQSAAKVAGGERADVDLTSGNFSLIVEGHNARLDPQTYRKFITALWSVYYSSQDPGISIDPIEPGGKKHLVRYIGKVINTDLGRVMRESDYLMKKWAVGTDRPHIKGFANPDDIAAKRGVVYVGAMSRFWFVPEEMKFKRGEDMLLFEDGKMTVKTEYLFKETGMRADPANEEFAAFFTDKYQQISEKYPVYKELFDYAKMVSLAKYLKEQGIPLYWFLMANKDLVLTEDSPSTVDALVKGSDFFSGVTIEGGVDLGFDVKREGNYVYDDVAVKAIHDAVSKLPANAYSRTTLASDKRPTATGAEPFTFDLGRESYTVVPQHSLTSGKDRRGIRYQTDLALRGKGLQLTGRALDEIRYEIIRRTVLQELYPLIELAERNKITEGEVESRYQEISRRAESQVATIVDDLKRLKDKNYTNEDSFVKTLEHLIGKEQTDRFKPLILKHAYYNTNLELVRYFKPGPQDNGEFGKGWKLLVPYRIKPSGTANRQFVNLVISQKMAVENLLTGEQEILTFDAERYSAAGYLPDKSASSQVIGLFMMTDASSRLIDKLGNEFWFDQAGYLMDMIFSEDHHIHLEYFDGVTDAFEKAPYEVRPADAERTDFLNVSIPKRMKITDRIHGDSEVLTFSNKGELAAYIPGNPEKSKYKMLAMMSDASFRLIAKNGNQAVISPSGQFDKMAFERRIIRSIAQGNRKLSFNYTVDKSGDLIIASANLFQSEEDTKPTYVVRYQYDEEGRLFSVKRAEPHVAASNERTENLMAVSD